MQTTVNQALDKLMSIESTRLKEHPELTEMKSRLQEMKFDPAFQGYGGRTLVEIPDDVWKLIHDLF